MQCNPSETINRVMYMGQDKYVDLCVCVCVGEFNAKIIFVWEEDYVA